MPCYLVMEARNGGHLWDGWSAPPVQPPIQTSTKPDGSYDSKPLDPHRPPIFWKNQKKFSTPSVQTADASFRPNPVYPNIVKPIFVWGKDVNVERCFKTPYNIFRSKSFLFQKFSQSQWFLLRRFLCWTPTPIQNPPTPQPWIRKENMAEDTRLKDRLNVLNSTHKHFNLNILHKQFTLKIYLKKQKIIII